jgi:cyclin A
MRQEELENRAKPNYMKKQQDITGSMRSILVDWLVEVSEEYKLNVETLYLAVNYTDRFLSQMSVLRGKLQLVGTAGMYIAAKYEEISPPDVTEFVYITDDTYTKKQVLRMEHLLLKVLDFRMNTPTINCFLTHFLRFLRMTQLNRSEKVESLARYLAELTLIESETYLSFLPSQIAAAAIYLAMYTLGKKWTEQIAEQIGYDFDLSGLKDCIVAMHKSMQQAPSLPQQAIQEKYKSSRFHGVANIDAPETLELLGDF